jgi:hypothetical protein
MAIFEIIGFLHFIFAFFISMYGIIFKKNWFDIVFMYYSVLVILSWTFYNGECVLTYYIKKMENPNYIAGSQSTDLTDMYLLVGTKQSTKIIASIGLLLNAISLYIVFNRNGFSNIMSALIASIHLLYITVIRLASISNQYFLIFQQMVKIFFIFILILLLSRFLP